MSATVWGILWAVCVVWLGATLWYVARTPRQPTPDEARAAAHAQWRRELEEFVAKHPVAGDDSDMVA